MGISFGSVGAAGSGVGCHPIYPPGHLFMSDVGPPGAWKVLFRGRAGHRSAQVTEQRHRESERFIVAIRTSQQKLSRSDLTKHRALPIHCEGHERTNVGEGVESAILVRASGWWSECEPPCSVVKSASAAIASRSTTRLTRCSASVACS
jgi:hypothetical protein